MDVIRHQSTHDMLEVEGGMETCKERNVDEWKVG
jgi:hypothetical protein